MKRKQIALIAAALVISIGLGFVFSVHVSAASTPSLFHNDERWYRDTSAGLEIIGGLYYVPVDVFGMFRHLELTMDSRRGEFMVYNRNTGAYISVLYSEKIASIKASQLKNEEEYSKLKEQMATIHLKLEDLARVIEIWTGVPSGSITANEFERLVGLDGRLKKRIVGQDAAVSAVCRAIKRNRAGVSYKKKPASFIFAGPTGVGKTELVKVLAEDLFDTPDALIRLDMSEFMEKHSVSRMVGSPPGYVGYDDAGQLTEKIRRRPYSVILFDEIEKAHPDVMNILLQILDDGRITDSHGKEVKFDNCVIVMTTNAGSQGVSSSIGFGETMALRAENKTEKALSEFLRPEFINRVDEIVTFRALDKENFAEIAKIMLGDLARTLWDKGIILRYSDAVPMHIAEKSFSAKYGARNMRRFISREIEDMAAEKIISGYERVISEISIDVKDDAFVIDVK